MPFASNQAPTPLQTNSSRPLNASRLTPIGRGAVATIRVSSAADEPLGSECDHSLLQLNSLFRAANGTPLSDQRLGRIAFGQWGIADGEDLVICRPSADTLEIHCHGGEAAVQRVLKDLENAGCCVMDWRTQVTESADLFESECLSILSQTSTWRTTKIVLEQANGLLRQSFSKLITLAEGHDVSEGHTIELIKALDELLEWANFGIHLSTPWSVVLTGRPNVGKSSLINALLGYQRAIVFDQPGTTRDVVTGETAFDGWPMILADTAGIREAASEIEAAGIALARQRLQTADLRLVLVDVSQLPTPDDHFLISEWPNALFVAHKSDLGNNWGDDLPKQAICVSSVTGAGLETLQREIVSRLIPKVPKPGTPIPISVRQVKILQAARQSLIAGKPGHAMLELINQLLAIAPMLCESSAVGL